MEVSGSRHHAAALFRGADVGSCAQKLYPWFRGGHALSRVGMKMTCRETSLVFSWR